MKILSHVHRYTLNKNSTTYLSTGFPPGLLKYTSEEILLKPLVRYTCREPHFMRTIGWIASAFRHGPACSPSLGQVGRRVCALYARIDISCRKDETRCAAATELDVKRHRGYCTSTTVRYQSSTRTVAIPHLRQILLLRCSIVC